MSASRTPLLAIALCALACNHNPAVQQPNQIPIAHAGPDQTLAFDGTPVTVTLDGRASHDPDGVIEDFRWLSGLEADAQAALTPGVHRKVPDNAEGGQAWPEDIEQPQVELPRGMWVFSLWVRDDRGAWSDPARVTISVGEDPIAACSAGVLPGVSDECKACACTTNAACPMLLAQTACNKDCWDLLYCVNRSCSPEDLTCITTNCAPLLGGAEQARAAGVCTSPCQGVCSGP